MIKIKHISTSNCIEEYQTCNSCKKANGSRNLKLHISPCKPTLSYSGDIYSNKIGGSIGERGEGRKLSLYIYICLYDHVWEAIESDFFDAFPCKQAIFPPPVENQTAARAGKRHETASHHHNCLFGRGSKGCGERRKKNKKTGKKELRIKIWQLLYEQHVRE